MNTPDRESTRDLIERSSLGTPAARALRARTPASVIDGILAGSREVASATPTESTTIEENLQLDLVVDRLTAAERQQTRTFSDLDEHATAALQGSEQAWLIIYTTLWMRTVEFVRRQTQLPRDLAEDLAQDAFVKALQTLGDWDPDRGRFVTWFFLITKSRCMQHWRTNRRTSQSYLEDEDFDPPSPVASASLEAVESWQLLAGPLRGLTQQNRDILFLKALFGFKSHEIAEMMEMTPEAIRKRLSVTRKNLRKALELKGGL